MNADMNAARQSLADDDMPDASDCNWHRYEPYENKYEPRERLQEKQGTILVFYAFEVLRDEEGKVRRKRNNEPVRGYYGLVHNDTAHPGCNPRTCWDDPHHVRFKAEVIFKAAFSGNLIKGRPGEKVKFAERAPYPKEGRFPVVVFMRSQTNISELRGKTFQYHGR